MPDESAFKQLIGTRRRIANQRKIIDRQESVLRWLDSDFASALGGIADVLPAGSAAKRSVQQAVDIMQARIEAALRPKERDDSDRGSPERSGQLEVDSSFL